MSNVEAIETMAGLSPAKAKTIEDRISVMKPITDISPGTIVIVTKGEYSSYECAIALRCVRQFTNDDLKAAILSSNAINIDEDPNWTSVNLDDDEFISHLIELGFFKEIEASRELHLGAYNELNVEDRGKVGET